MIYTGAPNFLIFGMGDYLYASYKVGVRGFYKKHLFSILVSESRKHVMTDDISYFICFLIYDMAYMAMIILNFEFKSSF